ncbi:hypothetical protein TRP8649_03251 [Pelagimonas phthalicica]|uniref:Uncharacterized protein n=2 Tax=Pelagimonas phthalicica TaxID=1037362 RepID=A0A238JER8_9RHOB|nr:hypothetical protein CLV87_3251 [Pelagimonas phthalicica]SMX29119.1 hypothetical protein TRP8649_03251 [Pelagimonas phthalicica]
MAQRFAKTKAMSLMQIRIEQDQTILTSTPTQEVTMVITTVTSPRRRLKIMTKSTTWPRKTVCNGSKTPRETVA